MSQPETILRIKAELDFEFTAQTPGTFTVSLANDVYECRWVPDKLAKFDVHKCNIENQTIFFLLNYITSIQFLKDKNVNCDCIIRFALPNITTYSRFLFYGENEEEIRDFIDDLIEEELLVQHKVFKNIYNVKMSTNKHFKFPTDALSLSHVQSIDAHRRKKEKMLESFNKDRSKHVDVLKIKQYIESSGKIKDFQKLKYEIMQNGLEDDNARILIWPYLFGFLKPEMTTREKDEYIEKLYQYYKHLRNQWNSFIETQKESLNKKFSIIMNDAKRTDRETEMFKDDSSPAFDFYERILSTYAIYNKNVGYVQGLGDYVALLMHIYIKNFVDTNTLINYEGKRIPTEKQESYIFWMFVNLLKTSHHDLIFENMASNQAFIAERVLEIVSPYNTAMNNWLKTQKLTKLLFLYRSYLLQYKRDFSDEYVKRIWDTFYSSEDPVAFPRFFAAALLFDVFPAITISDRGNLGDVMEAYENSLHWIDQNELLNFGIAFYENAKKDSNSDWLFMDFPNKQKESNFKPKYFKPIKF